MSRLSDTATLTVATVALFGLGSVLLIGVVLEVATERLTDRLRRLRR